MQKNLKKCEKYKKKLKIMQKNLKKCEKYL